MSPRPPVFISAVSSELHSARQLVANTLTFLGYEPVWQEIFDTGSGDLREDLRKRIDHCKGVVQLVGQCFGGEPPTIDDHFGRVSYTQYEGLYARQRGKKVWYVLIDESFPTDSHDPEPAELRELQAAYRQRIQRDAHLFHPLANNEALEARILKLRDDLSALRRGVKQWAIGVTLLAVLTAVASIWLLHGQRETKQGINETRDTLNTLTEEIAKLAIKKYPEVEDRVRQERAISKENGRVRQKQAGEKAADENRTYAQLSKQLGIDEALLRQNLPRFAEKLKNSSAATIYERANAAYVAKDYLDAERLALQAADEAQQAEPPRTADIIKSLLLAGRAADERIEYADALHHLHEAEKLTDRNRDALEWAHVQWELARVLDDDGKSDEAENRYRPAIIEYERVLGRESSEALSIRTDLGTALYYEAKFAESEAENRAVLKIREKILGLEAPETLTSRDNLAMAEEAQDKYAEAAAEHRAILRIREKLLGPEHPDTLTSRHNLAVAEEDQGKFAEAAEEFRAIIKIREVVLGPEHPETLDT